MASAAIDKGVYVMTLLNTLFVAPPLTVTEEQIEEGLEVVDEILRIADAECS
jgi:taurine--2-oxoglutarate transaminase